MATEHDDPRPTPTPTPTRTRTPHAPANVIVNANAPENGRTVDARTGFQHEKLEVYRVALEMARLAKNLADRIPRGYRNIADHLQRASGNTVLLLAEGANRRGAAEKRQRFAESRGECGEVGAAADLFLVYELVSAEEAAALKELAARVCSMLTRLIARFGGTGTGVGGEP